MRFLPQTFWLFGLLFLAVGSLKANEALEQGIKEFDAEKFSTAYDLWAPLARQDHAEAQLFMGVLYRYGLGVEQDQLKAAYWYERAANNGDIDAQGVKQDVWEANSWYQLVTDRDVCLSDTLPTGRLLVKDKYR